MKSQALIEFYRQEFAFSSFMHYQVSCIFNIDWPGLQTTAVQLRLFPFRNLQGFFSFPPLFLFLLLFLLLFLFNCCDAPPRGAPHGSWHLTQGNLWLMLSPWTMLLFLWSYLVLLWGYNQILNAVSGPYRRQVYTFFRIWILNLIISS